MTHSDAEYERVRQELAACSRRRDELERELADTVVQLSKLQGTYDAELEDHHRTRLALLGSRDSDAAGHDRVATLTRFREETESTLSSAQSVAEQLQLTHAELEAVRKRNHELEAQIAALSQRVSMVMQDHAAMRDHYEQLLALTEESGKRIVYLEQANEFLRGEVARLTDKPG